MKFTNEQRARIVSLVQQQIAGRGHTEFINQYIDFQEIILTVLAESNEPWENRALTRIEANAILWVKHPDPQVREYAASILTVLAESNEPWENRALARIEAKVILWGKHTDPQVREYAASLAEIILDAKYGTGL